MKKLILMLGLLILSSSAYNQAEVCESQCQAWKFVWQDDFAFDYVKTVCAKDPVDVGLEMVGFWADMATKGVGLQTFMEAYLCYDITTTYLHPQIAACGAACAADGLSYAPNLYLDDYSVYYSEAKKEIQVRIRNNGRAYVPGAYAAVLGGESDSREMPADFRLLANKTVPGLRPHNVLYLPEGYELGEYSFSVPYTPKADKYNVVRVAITTDPRYREMGVRDNTYDLVINDLPLPAHLWIESANFTRYGQTTSTYVIDALITNDGELPADAEVRYYLGSPHKGDLAASEVVRVLAGSRAASQQPIVFTPGSSTFVTIQLVSNGSILMDRTLYPNPAFYYVEGKVEDEAGRPIPGAWVRVGDFPSGDFPLTSGNAVIAQADEIGHYEFSEPFSEEKAMKISAQMNGYFTNSTTVSLEYGQDEVTRIAERHIYADIMMVQQPVEVNVGYPSNGRYIIETDKGRFTGDYTYGVPVPVRGANGTIFIASERCSFFAGKFSATYQHGYLEYRPNVTCLEPDMNDDYAVLPEEVLLWGKNYTGEEPRSVVFSKRGDHAYVLTTDTSTNYCNLYGYDLVSGRQLFRFASDSMCLQRSKISPAYDGSQVYVGMNAVRYANAGDTRARGYILAEDGSVRYAWDFPETSETLAHTSAGTMAELVLGKPFFYAPGNVTLEQCNLVQDRPCGAGGKSATIESLGLSKNRAVGRCNSTACIFTPAHGDIVMLDRHYANPLASGSYANDDVFVADHEGGAYFRGGSALWGTDERVTGASVSPGGSYIMLSYDPYGIEVLSPGGASLLNSSASSSGFEATERGLFYATHRGGRLSVYRMSTMVEPTSTTTSGGGSLNAGFVAQFFQVLVDFYNWLAQSISSMFGG